MGVVIGATLAACGGAFIGFLTASMLASVKISEANNKADHVNEHYNVLKARVRAIQDNGKPTGVGKRERQYSIQKPNGKFGKMFLPEV